MKTKKSVVGKILILFVSNPFSTVVLVSGFLCNV